MWIFFLLVLLFVIIYARAAFTPDVEETRAAPLNSVRADVVGALVRLGAKKTDAVRLTADVRPDEKFEVAFKRVMRTWRKR